MSSSQLRVVSQRKGIVSLIMIVFQSSHQSKFFSFYCFSSVPRNPISCQSPSITGNTSLFHTRFIRSRSTSTKRSIDRVIHRNNRTIYYAIKGSRSEEHSVYYFFLLSLWLLCDWTQKKCLEIPSRRKNTDTSTKNYMFVGVFLLIYLISIYYSIQANIIALSQKIMNEHGKSLPVFFWPDPGELLSNCPVK